MKIVGVGVDVEEVAAFRKKNISKNSRFYERIFSPGEIEYCCKFRDPYPHFAARFCAKEALVKAASPVVSLVVSDVEVKKIKNRPVYGNRSNRKLVSEFFKKHGVHLSISHTEQTASAFAIVTSQGRS